jgi:hypothetical protein
MPLYRDPNDPKSDMSPLDIELALPYPKKTILILSLFAGIINTYGTPVLLNLPDIFITKQVNEI